MPLKEEVQHLVFQSPCIWKYEASIKFKDGLNKIAGNLLLLRLSIFFTRAAEDLGFFSFKRKRVRYIKKAAISDYPLEFDSSTNLT